VKVHALFLVPATAVLILAIVVADARPGRLGRLAVAAVGDAVSFVIVRFGFGYVLVAMPR